MTQTKEKRKSGLAARVGMAGFLFFFLKGIIWLVVIYLGWRAQA